jgi:hypothetical protein
MLTRFLANSFVGLLELLMWLVVLSGTFAAVGSKVTGNVFFDAGVGLVLSLIFSAIFFGPIVMIIDMKKSVSNIERMLSKKNEF